MGDTPDVYELDGESFEKQTDTDPEDDPDDEKSVNDETDVGYPEEVVDEIEQETDVDMPKSDKDIVGQLELAEKIDVESDFTNLGDDDTVVIDTPLEGAKVGKVSSIEETWTGTLQAKVDTGANEYTITPFDDEYSASFVGSVNNSTDLKQDVLSLLNRRTVPEVEEGNDVVIDVPEIGPTRATVTDCVKTDNQGTRLTLKAGDVHFVVYEEPTPVQTKEQPYVVGEFR